MAPIHDRMPVILPQSAWASGSTRRTTTSRRCRACCPGARHAARRARRRHRRQQRAQQGPRADRAGRPASECRGVRDAGASQRTRTGVKHSDRPIGCELGADGAAAARGRLGRPTRRRWRRTAAPSSSSGSRGCACAAPRSRRRSRRRARSRSAARWATPITRVTSNRWATRSGAASIQWSTSSIGTTSAWPWAIGLIDMNTTQRVVAPHERAGDLAVDDPR